MGISSLIILLINYLNENTITLGIIFKTLVYCIITLLSGFIITFLTSFEKHCSKYMYLSSNLIKYSILFTFNIVITPYVYQIFDAIYYSTNQNDFITPYIFYNIIALDYYNILLNQLFLNYNVIQSLFFVLVDLFQFIYLIIRNYIIYKKIIRPVIERRNFDLISCYSNTLIRFCMTLTYGKN
jgi:hypothetical protein